MAIFMSSRENTFDLPLEIQSVRRWSPASLILGDTCKHSFYWRNDDVINDFDWPGVKYWKVIGDWDGWLEHFRASI